jgi:sugar phosphate isomerase/epimerase
MRLGGPVLDEIEDPVELAQAHKNLGFRAAFCPMDLSINDAERVDALRKAFAEADIVIAEVGAWCNPLDPRPDFAEFNINFITEKLALADEIGARCCVNIIGSYSEEFWYAPHQRNFSQEAFDRSVVIARNIIDAVKPKTAKLTFEIMPFCFLDGPENYLKLIQAIERKEIAVHLDPVNCINSVRSYYDHAALFEKCFEMLGPHIVSLHAKDLILRPEPPTVQLEEVRPGLGFIDYRVFLRCAASLPADVPLMLEHLNTQEEYSLAREHIAKVAGELGMHI